MSEENYSVFSVFNQVSQSYATAPHPNEQECEGSA